MPKFRMIHVDHYMCKPISPFDDLKSEISGRSVSKVPVIRIFGADFEGRKICLHVHGFYPYVALQGSKLNTKTDTEQSLNQTIKDLVSEIEGALEIVVGENNRPQGNVSEAPQNPPPPLPEFIAENDGDSNLAARILQERRPMTILGADQKSPIHRVEKVRAYNYYGYHNEQEDFLKLYLYNPRMVKQLAQMFEDCRVFGRFLPVFWAHLPYILLFFIDNNLRGMQFIEVDQLFWRKNKAPSPSSQSAASSHSGQPPVGASSADQPIDSNASRINEQLDIELITSDIDPISTCELEADVRFEWIMNRQRFGSNGNDDALKELWLDDQEASQATSLVDSKLPLFELERNYIQQLYESCDLNYTNINLELTDKPKRAAHSGREIVYHDSDDDSLDGLRYREDLDEIANEPSPEQASDSQTVEPLKALPSTSQVKQTSKISDDEFSDDDIEMSAVVNRLKLKVEPSDSKRIKTELSEIDIKPNLSHLVKQEIDSDMKPMIEAKISNQKDEEDEFSDDDQFMIAAIMKAESQIHLGQESQAPDQIKPENVISSPCDSLARSHSAQQLTPLLSAKSKKSRTERRRFSDNSMIDGRSVVCSTVNQTRTGSQRSTSSSREIVSHEYQHLCLMSMELHITTRDQLRPDPAFDPIESVFYCIRNDTPEISNKPAQVLGVIITDPFQQNQAFIEAATIMNSAKSPSSRSNMSFAQKIRTLLQKTGLSLADIELNIVESEIELIMALVEVVRSHDPEIMIGYEMEHLSWGYVLERASFLNLNISLALSRVVDTKLGQNSKSVESTFVQPIMFTGRMVFSTWRIIKHEINLNTCSYERIHHHALNERVPCFSFQTLTEWFNQNRNRWRVIDYYMVRVVGQLRILDKFDLIAKVSELARVYGTQFIDVITRGSQIGIESMMLRLAKLQSLTPLSATVMQRNKMKAPEALPLVMEPETNIYYDPVAVLDFQSLYPSVVIAYNYCYSTCLGRVSDLETNERHQFGCSHLHVDQKEVKRLLESNSVHVSPCGVAYVKRDIRRGVLPKMLSELILTRAMVKDQMKKNMKSETPNRRLQRILNHRQHGLKMMANTTYGYTGASYTGRMPCVEIADSIVSKGRETLENAIELVESRAEWGAKVIYGDTDSIFIQFKNCDRDTAFKRAYEMVDAITAANPHPIKMKFEKIYQPCVLQTKKRYCGFKYESPDQSKPEFEAKGIETVRRDCCPAAARMLEMALRIQFTTRDINQVKSYVQHQFIKIMSGKLSNIMDFIFARQYKPRDLDKTESVFVPAWQITKRLLATDPRSEPRVGERVPFVIIYGEPKTPLVNLAKTPIEVLENISYRINADYYIQKIICPTLNRVFCTMKVDTLGWYKSMPHQNIIHRSHYLIAQKQQRFGGSMKKQSTMSQYFSPSHCPVCAKSIPLSDDICDDCRSDLQSSVIRLTEEITRNQRKLFAYHQLCRACSSLERGDVRLSDGGDEHYNPCISYDCPNLFRYHQAKLDALNSNFLSQILKSLN